jgi:hypothetical protein
MVLRGGNGGRPRFVAFVGMLNRPKPCLSHRTHKDRTGPSSQRRLVVVRVLGALALLVALALPIQAAPCGAVPVGRVVFLKSGDIDPDVFVWDAKQRVVDYAHGYWRDSSEVMVHTMLAKPGTHAVVVQCYPGAVHKEGNDPRDLVGIRLTTGPNKGRYGWVTSDDVHELAKR